jgi:hypothetical protein
MRITACVGALVLALAVAQPDPAQSPDWIELTRDAAAREGWQNVGADWMVAGDAELRSDNPRRISPKPGEGVLLNGPLGIARNLVTKPKYADAEAHVEFLISRGSNSGVKLQGIYEIQILDTHGKQDLTGDAMGGVYPWAEDRPRYHHLDIGTPPKVNAAKPAGEWQTLDITFRAPRFDASGRKIENARFLKVMLNGQLVQEDVELLRPTGANWRLAKEVPTGPLLLQGDHGPVAFRNVRIRPLPGAGSTGKPAP